MPPDPSAVYRRLCIGQFQVLSRIAAGGMGAVYKARDTILNQLVALKVLAPEMASREIMRKRFQLEARHGRLLPPQDNVVTLYKTGRAKGIYYLALEYFPGVDLKEFLRRKGRLEVAESWIIMVQAARALGHLHRHGIIHRDIKPANFLLVPRRGFPGIKLIDLGLSWHREDEEMCPFLLPGTTLGTADYIAPEQAANPGAADARSDIYSLGCAWHHLLAGAPPFGGGTVTERIYRHIEVDPPEIRARNPRVPAGVVKVLRRMMAKNPGERYQTAFDLLQDLEDAHAVCTFGGASGRPGHGPRPRGVGVL